MRSASHLAAGLRLAGPAALAVALLIGLLLFQHKRHGWPFSLHHGIGVPAQPAPAAPPAAASASAAHPRVPVELAPQQLETLGIRVEEARVAVISDPIRAVATVVPDESRVSHVHTRVSGWLEKLHVSTTGQRVKVGQPLAGIFSQELYASQVEYLSAVKASGGGLASAVSATARSRLKVLGMSDSEINALERRGEPHRLVTLIAPRSGVVLRRGVAVGTSVDPSTELVTIADLSRVWVLAEVAESSASAIKEGTSAMLDFKGSGSGAFPAKVEFVYPTLTERTRTLRVRFSVANPEGRLRPGLYGTAEFRLDPRQTLTVSRDAVVDTGARQHVFVVTAPGRFEPREVQLGASHPDQVEVRAGLAAGDQVVSSGVFLIDSESRLRASGGGTGHSGHGHGEHDAPQPPVAPPHKGHGG